MIGKLEKASGWAFPAPSEQPRDLATPSLLEAGPGLPEERKHKTRGSRLLPEGRDHVTKSVRGS